MIEYELEWSGPKNCGLPLFPGELKKKTAGTTAADPGWPTNQLRGVLCRKVAVHHLHAGLPERLHQRVAVDDDLDVDGSRGVDRIGPVMVGLAAPFVDARLERLRPVEGLLFVEDVV